MFPTGIIDQPGFVSCSNYLLMWDVKVAVAQQPNSMAVADSVKKSKHKLNVGKSVYYNSCYITF